MSYVCRRPLTSTRVGDTLDIPQCAGLMCPNDDGTLLACSTCGREAAPEKET